MSRTSVQGSWLGRSLGFLLGAAYIINAGAGTTTVTVGNASATVTGSGKTVLNFPVTRTGDTSYDAYLNYQTIDGTGSSAAKAGKDYVDVTGSLLLPAGASNVTLPVTVLGSLAASQDKNLALRLLAAGSLAPSAGLNPVAKSAGNNPNTQAYAVADINRDGKPDVISVENDFAGISVYINTTSASLTFSSEKRFSVSSSTSTGLVISALAVSDVNGDGMPDVVVTNAVDNVVTILINTTQPGSSTITFASSQSFPASNDASTTPVSVASKDLNDDGRPDLIVALSNGGRVNVLMNRSIMGTATAQFASVQTVYSGTNIVTIGDPNQDGKPDLLLVTGNNTVGVLINMTASGAQSVTFAAVQSFTAGNGVSYIKEADMNGDGQPDLITANVTDSTISILRNISAIGSIFLTYTTQQVFGSSFGTGTQFKSNELVVMDANGDGKPDVVVTQSGQTIQGIGAWLNTTSPGAATFSLTATPLRNGSVTQATQYANLIACDMDTDGSPDILGLDKSSPSKVSIFLGGGAPGGGAISFVASHNISGFTDSGAVFVADVNTDGKPDLVNLRSLPKSVLVALNTTTSGSNTVSYSAIQSFSVSGTPNGITSGDLNGDGKVDLAVETTGTHSQIVVLRNTTAINGTTASFATGQTFSSSDYANLSPDIRAYDVNRDSKPDLVAPTTGGLINLYLNGTSAGASTITLTAGNTAAAPHSSAPSQLVDVNGDGIPDLVYETSTGFDVVINGWPTLSSQSISGVVNGTNEFTLADVNGDGKPDLIYLTSQDPVGTGFVVGLNTTSTGATTVTFSFSQVIGAMLNTGALVAADMDGDGRPDVVVIDNGPVGGDVNNCAAYVFLNTTAAAATVSTVSFARSQSLQVDSSGKCNDLQAFDVNTDGYQDLLATSDLPDDTDILVNKEHMQGVLSIYAATGTIHYALTQPALSFTAPIASLVIDPAQAFVGSLSAPGSLSVSLNGAASVDVPLDPDHAFSYQAALAGDPNAITGVLNTLTFVGVDAYGNKTTVTKTITLDTVAPTITFTSTVLTPTQGYTLTGVSNEDGTVTINNGTPLNVVHGQVFTYPASPATLTLADGDNTFTVVTTDAATNSRTQSFTVTYDRVPPQLNFTSGLYTTGDSHTFTGTMNEAGSLYVALAPSTPITPITLIPNGDGTFYFTYIVSSLLTDSDYTYSFHATDLAGNSYDQDVTVTRDTHNPALTVDAPSYVKQLSLDVPVTVSEPGTFTITNADTSRPGYPIQMNIDASNLAFTVTLPLLDGENELVFSFKDRAGLYADSVSRTINVDRTAPLITITSRQYVNHTDYTLTGTLNEEGYVSVNGSALAHVMANQPFNVDDPTSLSLGGTANTLPVHAEDLAGNSLDESFNVYASTVVPVVTITAPADGSTFESRYQVLSGHVSESVTSLIMNGRRVSVLADNSFSTNITLQSGSNTYTVDATDKFDNRGAAGVTVTLNNPSLPTPVGALIQVHMAGTSLNVIGQPGSVYPSSAGATVTVTVTDVTTGDHNSYGAGMDGSFTVNLVGPNDALSDTFSVMASLGTELSPVIYLHGDDAPLALHITSPCEGMACNSAITIDGDTVNIAGTYTGPADTGIAVNGKPASLVNGQFFLNNLPLTLGTNTINIIATTAGGLWTSEVLTINSLGPSTLVLTASPTGTGIAPLTVNFHYEFQGDGATVQTLKMSYLGNGTDDVVTSDPDTVLSHTYTDPGTYPVTLTIIDSNGQQHQALLPVSVQDISIIGASIRKTWSDLGVALAKGDRAAAMNYLDYTAQQKYEPIFDVLLPDMPGIVSSFSPPLGMSISNGYAQFTVVRVINGQAEVFFIYFVLGEDGVWRLDTM